MPQKNVPSLPDHRECEILTGLTVSNVPRDLSLGKKFIFQKGDDVWEPESRSDSIFFLQSGQVIIIASDRDGREVALAAVEAGEPFGELCFCAPKRHFLRGTYARVATESQVLEVKLDDFINYLQENAGALQTFTFTFCCRLSDCQSRVEFLAYRGAEERLGRTLLHLTATRGQRNDEQKRQIILPVSHDELARIAAMSRPHVTVTMGKFRRLGLVNYGRNNPLTIDVEALEIYLMEISQS